MRPIPLVPSRPTGAWRGLLVAALLLVALLAVRPDPVAAVYVAPTGPTEILAAALYHTCGLTPAGAADCWGWDDSGQAGGAAEHPGPYTQLAAGAYHTCGLTPAGAADCWGYDGDGQAGNAAEHPGPFTQLAAGGRHTCGLTPEGAADCWGHDVEGQAGGAAEHPGPYTQLTAGEYHTCGLTPAGAADCWGWDGHGQAGDATEHPGPYTQLAAGYAYTCGLTPAGAADCWGNDLFGQAGGAAEHPGPYTQLTAGDYHTCGLTPAGAADCWGWDAESQAGDAAEHPGPYTQLAAGGVHTCGLTPAGAADCWGGDGEGQAGGAAEHPGPYGPYTPATGGEITVEKVVDGTTPGDVWAFNGSPDIGDFDLPAAGGDETFGDLAAGDYTISETDIGGWVVAASCTPGGETGDDSVTVTLADGDAVTCTFTNTLCLAGTYDDGAACVEADPGYYVDTDGATAQIECWLGTYSSSPGAVACVAADPGHYAKQNPADGQLACSPGRYQPNNNGYFCYIADEGYYVPGSAATAQTACEPGKYQDEEGQDFCKLAWAGHYAEGYANTTDTACSAGTYQPNPGQSFCYSADPGHYVPSSGQSQQSACAPGTVQPDSGQSSCRMTYPGTYAPDSGMEDGLPCEPGTYQDQHGQTSCKTADAGFYVPGPGATEQTACPSGTTSPAGSDSIDDCTATTGTIVIVKSADLEDDTLFGFIENIENVSFGLQDPSDNTKTFSDVPSGSYFVTEAAALGWTLDDIVCTDDEDDTLVDVDTRTATINLTAGETVTCTFYNTIDTGTITIVKDAQPEDDTEFDFTHDFNEVFGLNVQAIGGEFTLKDPSDNSETFTVIPGSYSVTEDAAADWTLDEVSCDDTDSTGDKFTRTANINLAAGETVTCTFTNLINRGKIVIIKDADPDDPTDFEFLVHDLGIPAVVDTFSLDDDSDGTLANEHETIVTQGTYLVSETPVADWTLEPIDCSSTNPDRVFTPTFDNTNNGEGVVFDILNQEVITCTFTNTYDPQVPTGTIIIAKSAHPADDTLFSYTEDIENVGFSLQDPSSNTKTFSDVPVGAYTVTEAAAPGWMLIDIFCSDTNSIGEADIRAATINLEEGEIVTCTFTNVQGSTADTQVFMSATAAGTTADGLSFGPHDILRYDGSEWSKWFSGSAAGLMPNGTAKHNINAFFIGDPAGESVLMSFAQNARAVPGIPGKVDGTDVVAWDGNVFEPFIDGSDVGLTNLTQEKIDGLHALDGSDSPINGGDCFVYLLISTTGPGKVPNHTGGTLNFSGEDVLGFCATSLGPNTAGLWHMVLDGSTQGMPRNSTDSISLSDDGNTLYLTTKGTFNVDDATGGHSMVYAYDLTTTEFSGPLFRAANAGLNSKVDGLQFENGD